MESSTALERFEKVNGGREAAIQSDNGMILYPTGAARERGMGVLSNPAADPRERAKRVVEYHQTKLKRAVRKFNEFKTKFTNAAKRGSPMTVSSGPPLNVAVHISNEDALKELRRLEQEVRTAQLGVGDANEAFRAAMSAGPSAAELKQRAAIEAELAEKRERLLEEIQSVEV